MRPFLIKVSGSLFALLLVFATFQSCNKDEIQLDEPAAMRRSDAPALVMPDIDIQDNPVLTPEEREPIIVDLTNYPNLTKKPVIQTRLSGCADGLSPTSITATLASEESITQTLTACLDPVPPAGDILFSMDLTGSMGSALASAKLNAVDIMNSIIGLGLDAQFGLVSHMDYPAYYSSCGYSNSYGSSGYGCGDYAYNRDQSITGTILDVANAINGLSLGCGDDGPECYERVFYEAYSDPLIGWRDGAAKILVAFLDYIPHDCDLLKDGTFTTGSDPGRDEIMGTGDDIDFHDAIQGLIDNDITLVVLNSYGSYQSFWEEHAAATGGDAELLGGDITAQISGLVAAAVGHIDELTIVPTAYASWVGTDPMAHEDIDLEEQQTRTFDVTITVPPGTPDGTYAFELKLMGDGIEYGSTWVEITVVNIVEVGVDIHPGSCPNPLNTKAKGVIPVSICGMADFDVADIDVSTVRLAGVAPIWEAIDDDATPYEPFVDKPLNIYSCNEMGPDGYMDLKLKFNNQQVIAALGPLSKGDVVRLILTGELFDGTPIIGEDIVKIAN
jgi:hypothetical protein